LGDRSGVREFTSSQSWRRLIPASISHRRYRIVWLGAASLSAIERETMHVPMAPRVISNGIARAKLTSALLMAF